MTWEYKVVRTKVDLGAPSAGDDLGKSLNEWGSTGWELVGVQTSGRATLLFLKREGVAEQLDSPAPETAGSPPASLNPYA